MECEHSPGPCRADSSPAIAGRVADRELLEVGRLRSSKSQKTRSVVDAAGQRHAEAMGDGAARQRPATGRRSPVHAVQYPVASYAIRIERYDVRWAKFLRYAIRIERYET